MASKLMPTGWLAVLLLAVMPALADATLEFNCNLLIPFSARHLAWVGAFVG